MNIYQDYKLTPEKEKEMWRDSQIIFDTSALCSLYYLSDYYIDIMVKIFNHFGNRLWIPHFVKYEFYRNRESVMCKPISEKYYNPKFLNNQFCKEVQKFIELWGNNQYFHPYIDPDKIEKISELLKEVKKGTIEIKSITQSEYNKRKEEIRNRLSDDLVAKFVDSLPSGPELSFREIKDIMREGEFRYRNSLPPGYMDATACNGKTPKSGVSLYGDLIIWKEIIRYAKNEAKDILLIIDDQKEDWFTLSSDEKSPRIELLTEFYEETDHNIYFYTTNQLITKLKEHYPSEENTLPIFSDLENVIVALDKLKQEREQGQLVNGQRMVIKCKKCGTKFSVFSGDLNWDSSRDYDRGMGIETEWHGEQEQCCPSCDSVVKVDSFLVEYPSGTLNYESTDCDGADIVSPWSLKNDFYSILSEKNDCDEVEPCEICGNLDVLDSSGLCSECASKLEDSLSED